MKVTRNVILDLLPLYLADEVSADTRALVDEYIETDPELARVAKRTTAIELPDDVPSPLTKENEMKAYSEAQRAIFWRTVILAVVIAFTLLALLAFAGVAALFLFTA